MGKPQKILTTLLWCCAVLGMLLFLALSSAKREAQPMMAASSAQGTLEGPPADIDSTVDDKGDLIYRCRHKTPHKWDMQGHRL